MKITVFHKENTSIRIYCAKCDKPVDKITWQTLFDTRQIVIECFCHGETVRRSFPERSFANAKVIEGTAFEDEKLGEKTT